MRTTIILVPLSVLLIAGGPPVSSPSVSPPSVSSPPVASSAREGTGSIAPPPPPAEVADMQAAIDYDHTQRMTLPVRINDGASVPFLVDTGSERTVISEELAVRLGLPAAANVRISSIAGTSTAAAAHVRALDFTNISVNDLVTPILKGGHMGAQGLIGIDSLQKKLVIFDFDKNQMEIRTAKKRASASAIKNEEIVVTASTRAGRLIVTDAEVDGIRTTVVIDSGAQFSIGNPALRAKLDRRKRLHNPVETVLYSVTGHVLAAQIAKVRSLDIGKMMMTDVPVAFADSPAFATLRLQDKPALLLGMNSLRAFRRVEVDFTNRRVKFTTPDAAGYTPERQYAKACQSLPAQCGQRAPAS